MVTKIRPLIEHGLHWKVGNVKNDVTWKHKWILAAPEEELPTKPENCEDKMVGDCIGEDKRWNTGKLIRVWPLNLVNCITAMALPSEEKEYSVYKKFESYGNYTVKSTYKEMKEISNCE